MNRASSSRPTTSFIRSPLSIAAALIAGMHSVGAVAFILYWNQQPSFHLEMFASYVVFFASAMLFAGIGASMFAPQTYRTALIVLNVLPIAWWLLV